MRFSRRAFLMSFILGVTLVALGFPRSAASQGEKMLSPTEIGDKLAIHELMARYNFALDSVDVERWVACFTNDGVLENPFGTYRGSDSLRKYISATSKERRERPFRHMLTNIVVDIHGDEANARCYVLLARILRDSDSLELLSTLIYSDQLRKIEGTWRFSHRKFELDAKGWVKRGLPR